MTWHVFWRITLLVVMLPWPVLVVVVAIHICARVLAAISFPRREK